MITTKKIDNRQYILGLSLIAAAILVVSSQNVFVTGCPTQFIGEHVQNAKLALQNGDTQEAMNQLDQAEQAIAMISSEEE